MSTVTVFENTVRKNMSRKHRKSKRRKRPPTPIFELSDKSNTLPKTHTQRLYSMLANKQYDCICENIANVL